MAIMVVVYHCLESCSKQAVLLFVQLHMNLMQAFISPHAASVTAQTCKFVPTTVQPLHHTV